MSLEENTTKTKINIIDDYIEFTAGKEVTRSCCVDNNETNRNLIQNSVWYISAVSPWVHKKEGNKRIYLYDLLNINRNDIVFKNNDCCDFRSSNIELKDSYVKYEIKGDVIEMSLINSDKICFIDYSENNIDIVKLGGWKLYRKKVIREVQSKKQYLYKLLDVDLKEYSFISNKHLDFRSKNFKNKETHKNGNVYKLDDESFSIVWYVGGHKYTEKVYCKKDQYDLAFKEAKDREKYYTLNKIIKNDKTDLKYNYLSKSKKSNKTNKPQKINIEVETKTKFEEGDRVLVDDSYFKIYLDSERFYLIDKEDIDLIENGCKEHKTGYIYIRGIHFVYLHRAVMLKYDTIDDELTVHHINFNKFDNRKSNLDLVNQSVQNSERPKVKRKENARIIPYNFELSKYIEYYFDKSDNREYFTFNPTNESDYKPIFGKSSLNSSKSKKISIQEKFDQINAMKSVYTTYFDIPGEDHPSELKDTKNYEEVRDLINKCKLDFQQRWFPLLEENIIEPDSNLFEGYNSQWDILPTNMKKYQGSIDSRQKDNIVLTFKTKNPDIPENHRLFKFPINKYESKEKAVNTCIEFKKTFCDYYNLVKNRYNIKNNTIEFDIGNGLKGLMDYSPGNLELLNNYIWTIKSGTNCVLATKGNEKIYMHKVLFDDICKDEIFHINRINYDNRRENIKNITPAERTKETVKYKSNSGHKYICDIPKSNKFQIKYGDKKNKYKFVKYTENNKEEKLIEAIKLRDSLN